jgi:hypothetical protein
MRLNVLPVIYFPRKAVWISVVNASLLGVAFLSYAIWLTNRHLHLFWSPGQGLNLTFNSMLEHLLRGEFDVDPSTVGPEGFYRDGHVFAYWGIFLALIRWPLALFPGGLKIDVTFLSCFVAVCIAAYVKLRTLHIAFLVSPSSATRNILYSTLAMSILFAGPQIEFLRATLYQEVCLWAGALASIFVYFAIRGLILRRFSTSSLCAMAFTAGLVLLARVSTGVGIYVALGLLLLTMLIQDSASKQGVERAAGCRSLLLAHVLSRRFLLPTLVLLSFAAVTGLVNYYRWGHPLIFADYRLYLFNPTYPDRLPRMQAHGLFNLSRLPFGLVYYFLPLWVLRRPDGHLLFEEHQHQWIDVAELPPSSFFLTDALLLILLLYSGWALFRRRRAAGVNRFQALAIVMGLTVPCFLMLSAISMNFRYRIDFYPLIEFGAWLGFMLLCGRTLASNSMRRVGSLAIASAALGIVGSHVIMILYKLSDAGPATELMRVGVVTYYLHQIHAYWPGFASWLPR